MPQQEIFMDERMGKRRIQVLKSYDTEFARGAFDAMDEGALAFLSLRLRTEDLPAPGSPDFTDMVGQEVEDGAREDGTRFRTLLSRRALKADLDPSLYHLTGQALKRSLVQTLIAP